MKDLLSILRDAPGSIRLEVSGEDLLAFSKSLIDRAKEELAAQVAEARKERYLTKDRSKSYAAFATRRSGIGTAKGI